jgi:hypothetical protein
MSHTPMSLAPTQSHTIPSMPVAKPVRVLPVSLEGSAASVMAELQHACASLLDAFPAGITRPIHLERALQVDKKLAWQVFRLGRSSQPMAEAGNVPPRTAVRRLLAAAEQANLPKNVIARTEQAFERFDAFIAEHGGDRSDVVSMLGGLGFDGGGEAHLKTRKTLFRGNGSVWGIQTAIYTKTVVFQRGLAPDKRVDDVVIINGYIGLQRLRSTAPMALNSFIYAVNQPETVGGRGKDELRQIGSFEPPPQRTIGGMEVLAPFSSQPLPEMIERTDHTGKVETELVFPASGRSGAITLYTAQVMRSAAEGEQSQYSSNVAVSLPIETFVTDLLVPAGWTDPGSARMGVYGRRGAVDRVIEFRAADLIPQREAITYMGSLEVSPPVAGAPQHADAVRDMLLRLGWLGARFDVYRCTVKYPVLHTMVRIAVDTVKP